MQRRYRLGAGRRRAAEDPGQLRRVGVGVLLAAAGRREDGARAARRAQGRRLPPGPDPGAGGDHRPLRAVHARRLPRRRGRRREDACRCRVLRRIICSGEELPADVAARCLQTLPAELHNLYGPTEAAIDVSAWQCTPDALAGLARVPIGGPIQNLRLHVLDPRLRAGAGRRAGGAVPRRRRAGARISAPPRADRRAVRARPVRAAGIAALPDRGPGAVAAGRHRRVPGPDRRPGEDQGPADRARRDRGGAARAARRRGRRRRGARGRPGRPAHRRLRRRRRRARPHCARRSSDGCPTTWSPRPSRPWTRFRCCPTASSTGARCRPRSAAATRPRSTPRRSPVRRRRSRRSGPRCCTSSGSALTTTSSTSAATRCWPRR